MTEEKYTSLKTAYVEFITKIIKDFGGLPPAITILGMRKDNQENAVIHIPIPDFLMNSEKGKDEFIDDVVPELATKVNRDFEVLCVAWASEAWIRSVPKEQTDVPVDWKSIPKKEALFVSIESADKNDVIMMEIVRKGQQVNADGQLTDHVELLPLPDFLGTPERMEGRFAGLYKKFTTG
jgi:hypothetical protein